jgi:threonine dehydrogenase-like Zn-dependent dehydrogenase
MNRRQFLRTSTLASLALCAHSYAAETADQRKRVGLIGCGWYGKNDLFRLLQVAPVEVVSLCDVDRHMREEAAEMVAARQSSKKKPRLYGDYRQMLAGKDLEIVLVGTPDHWHALPMIAAVESGADVYVQKPISVDIREGQAMLAAARKHNRVVQVGTQRRSTPHLIEARDQIIKTGKVTTRCEPMKTRLTPRRLSISITKCGRVPRRCGRLTDSIIREAGAPSWNTATASSATCASTCST